MEKSFCLFGKVDAKIIMRCKIMSIDDINEYSITALCGLGYLLTISLIPIALIVMFPFYCIGFIGNKIYKAIEEKIQ